MGRAGGAAPHPQRPVVARVRLRFTRRGRLRFASHRDVQRAFERALRRAAVPIAFSQGFSPHPRVSWAGAAPTGAASEAEYVELGLQDPVDPAVLARALDSALPDGVDVVDAVAVPPGAGSLAERLEASWWRVELPGVDGTVARAAAEAFLATAQVQVERLTTSGTKVLDVRAAVVSLEVVEVADRAGEDPCAILDVVVRHRTPAVRPDDVLTGLRRTASFDLAAPARATRLAQGPLDGRTGAVGDPLAPDREAPLLEGAAAAPPAEPVARRLPGA